MKSLFSPQRRRGLRGRAVLNLAFFAHYAGSSFLLLTFAGGNVFAIGPIQDIPIVHYVFDYDSKGMPYSIQSDGGGTYRNGVDDDISVLMANGYNHIVWGDRLLQNGNIRTLAITFSQENAVKPGDSGYLVPARPPKWGTVYDGVRFMNKCTADSLSMLAMKPGDKIICQMHIRMFPLDSRGSFYRFDMGTSDEPETQKVQISCFDADSDGCADWYINPMPVVNLDGSTSPGKTRGRLWWFGRTTENRGGFYMTFHIHVVRQSGRQHDRPEGYLRFLSWFH